jgi:hypothetical protein
MKKHHEAALFHLLAAKAGQVEKRSLQEDEAAEAALDEEEGLGSMQPPPLPLPLATKAGQKRRSRRRPLIRLKCIYNF